MLAIIGLLLAIYLPLFGLSLVIVLVLDFMVFLRIEPAAVWLDCRRAAAVALLVLLSFVGCSGTPSPVTGGTKGVLTSDGKPISQMQVNVYATLPSVIDTPIGRGFTNERGEFELVEAKTDEPLNLGPGSYRYTIESVGAEVQIPKDYQDAEKTPLHQPFAGDEVIKLSMPKLLGMP